MAEERTAVLDSVVDHGADTRSFLFRIPGGLAFRPGQFLSCLLPVGGERLIRPYSIASSPEEPARVELLLNLVPGGPGSRYLFDLTPGALLTFTGPWGTFVLDRAPEAEAVFIAIETGIAPIRPMVHRAAGTATHPLTLLYGASHPIYRDELAALGGLRLCHVCPEVLEDVVRQRYLEDDADRSRHFFICGVGDVVPRLRNALRAGGYARRAVQYEQW
jgi:glycine betaine monooxygenase B